MARSVLVAAAAAVWSTSCIRREVHTCLPRTGGQPCDTQVLGEVETRHLKEREGLGESGLSVARWRDRNSSRVLEQKRDGGPEGLG